MKNSYQVNNRGKKMGRVHFFNKYRNLIFAGAVMTLVGGSTAYGIHSYNEYKEEQRIEQQAELEEFLATATPYEPTYSVEYEVQTGDTLLGIVGRYENEVNQQYKDVSIIVDKNDLPSQEQIQRGDVITLYGVPESSLEEFGYTADYIGNETNYIKDMYAFVSEHKDSISWSEDEEEAMEAFNYLYDYVDTYVNDESIYENSEMVDSMIDHLINMCETIEKHTGLDFENHKTAYKISELESTMAYTTETKSR